VKGEEAPYPATGIAHLRVLMPESEQDRRGEEKNIKGKGLENRRRKRKKAKEHTRKIEKVKRKEIGGKPQCRTHPFGEQMANLPGQIALRVAGLVREESND
jgi:hypothetical protein